MGCYINPPNMEKEQWLRENATPLTHVRPAEVLTKSTVPICLVSNGPFNAAGVAFSHDEVEAFDRPGDPRPKLWFVAPRHLVREVSDLESWERHARPETFPVATAR